ncbi:hypothetical protein CAG61_08440 [Vibrio sp. V34_P3A8T189]|uniref:hypothetical protein n=1 Tax=unclassified Vibrio TaxID=2614977 RepID=UPI0013730F6B|nr:MULTISPECIES: hypothetical protein [unclassified Vibrio]NAW78339.1 hypothetical protein [Vibrio sp. V33_P6A3T137]NAX01882.1 hypothetical protein [Vibrio sp. V34_P3A8T189]NAX08239.1 hypothetical protein [Vibrio sp. V40_P2S30T141]
MSNSTKTNYLTCDDNQDLGVIFNYDPTLDREEIHIQNFKINQIAMCAAIAKELSRQHPGITAEQSQMSAIIKAADLVCDAVENQLKDIKPVVHWNSPKIKPDVPKGEAKTFWLAARHKRADTWVELVFYAQYVNKPIEFAEDDIEQECPLDDSHLVTIDGDPVEAIGWYSLMNHPEFSTYYEPIVFNDQYELLGWAEYRTPEFKCQKGNV